MELYWETQILSSQNSWKAITSKNIITDTALIFLIEDFFKEWALLSDLAVSVSCGCSPVQPESNNIASVSRNDVFAKFDAHR